ncbi:MAG: PhnD/SsuA/transferrin family substrate-binding protein [Burkholderiales bacterium]|nr:PhnD/SsuA/transferrin family substrate-binding protein [Burkholderiales bacterium]
MTPVANARMYSATPAAKQAWKVLLGWALARAGLEWEVLDYDVPAPLAALWARDDLGCVLMCGLPFTQRAPRPALVASPVPAGERYAGRPVYFTDFAVRADAPYGTLEDTFGGVVGFTLADSYSGCVALRAHLLPHRQARGAPLYRSAVGGFVNARKIIEALDKGRIDVGPLDSYYFDLLRANDPDCAAKVRLVGSTDAAPIPAFIATAALAAPDLERLRNALLEAGTVPELGAQRSLLQLARFAVPREQDYTTIGSALARSRSFPDPW